MAEPVGAPFTAYIGGMLEEISEGYARISLQTGAGAAGGFGNVDTGGLAWLVGAGGAGHADGFGSVHTGVLTSLMDSAIGIALGRLRGEGAREREGPHATI